MCLTLFFLGGFTLARILCTVFLTLVNGHESSQRWKKSVKLLKMRAGGGGLGNSGNGRIETCFELGHLP